MSPHAVPAPNEQINQNRRTSNGPSSNGHSKPSDGINRSLLLYHDGDEVQDLICIGFGPASLAIAVALHDALECDDTSLRTDQPKVRFLERQPHFAWHAGMLLPGAKMQITFIKDLATLRNPRSQFTFLNYLHRKGRLVQFTNLGTFLPQRIEYEDYMKWCAGWFDDVVEYGQSVQGVTSGKTNPITGAVEHFNVISRDIDSGRAIIRKAKHVVIATGGQPNMPQCLPSNHPRIVHSSQYATSISKMFRNDRQPASIAVIGAGQSAAEVFNNIPSRFPNAKTHLIIRGAALRPSDDSPFVNEIFDPSQVDSVYAQDSHSRQQALDLDRGTNYGVVRLELLEDIYSTLYSYRIRYGDEKQWPQRILTHRDVVGARDVEVDGRSVIQLRLRDTSEEPTAQKTSMFETLDVDLVIVASGYRRDAHEDILQDLRPLMVGGEAAGKKWSVEREYGVKFREGAVQADAGIWLQGCNEATHGLSDTLLSILAVRGGEVVQSIFGRPQTV